MFLLFNYNNGSYDPIMDTFLKEYPTVETVENFLHIIADTELALTDENTSCRMVANAWIHDATPEEQEDVISPDGYPE